MRPILVLTVTTLLCIEPACSAVTSAEGVSGHSDVRSIPGAALAAISGVPLIPERIDALAAAAHMASIELPADPSTPAPTDATRMAVGGGPC